MRLLNVNYRSGRSFQMIKKLVDPLPCEDVAQVRERVVAWEEEVKRYEEASGEMLSEATKLSAINSLAPEAIKQHIALNEENFTSYNSVRQLMYRYADVVTTKDNGPKPMDLVSYNSGKGPGGKPWKGGIKGYQKGKGPKGYSKGYP